MTRTEAREILARVRCGDKTLTLDQINQALIVSGDLIGCRELSTELESA
jgi:hypothetical protein